MNNGTHHSEKLLQESLEIMSPSFEYFDAFLDIAKDIPKRIEKLDTHFLEEEEDFSEEYYFLKKNEINKNNRENFFKGEHKVVRFFKLFKDLDIISETEYNHLLENSFEESIYIMLKYIYLRDYFAENIRTVTGMHKVLIQIGTLLGKTDIEEIRNFYQEKVTKALTEKNTSEIKDLFSSNNIPDAKTSINILKNNTFNEIEILFSEIRYGKYTEENQILFLRILKRLLLEEVINQTEFETYNNIQAHISAPYDLLDILGTREYFIEDMSFAKEVDKSLRAYIEVQKEKGTETIVYCEIQKLFYKTRFGIYTETDHLAFNKIVIMLSAENVITPQQIKICSDIGYHVSAAYYLFSNLMNQNYFKSNSSFEEEVGILISAYDEVQNEKIQEVPINEGILNFSKSIFSYLLESSNSIDFPDDFEYFLDDFVSYLLENDIFSASYVGSVVYEKPIDRAIEHLLRLAIAGHFDTDIEFLEEIKSIVIEKHPEKESYNFQILENHMTPVQETKK